MPIPELVELIREKVAKRSMRGKFNVERVASILERDGQKTFANWLSRVKLDEELTGIV